MVFLLSATIKSTQESRGIKVDLCAGGNIEKSEAFFREENSIVQVSGEVKHFEPHFYQVRFLFLSWTDYFNHFVMKHDVCILPILDVVYTVVK